MKTYQNNTKANRTDILHKSGFCLTREIQGKVSFQLDLDQMELLSATAEVLHSGIFIGQIQKAGFGVRFEPYQEEVAALELHLLLELNGIKTPAFPLANKPEGKTRRITKSKQR